MVYNLDVTADGRIEVFGEKALAAGIPHQVQVGMLTSQGWAEKDVYAALAEHYERVTGNLVPHRAGSGTSAKEAFFYLLIFATLATWTFGLGCLAFDLIDRWLADPLFSQYGQSFDTSTITSSLLWRTCCAGRSRCGLQRNCWLVLGLSGGVFWYYFGGLRRTQETGTGRDRRMAPVAPAAVVVAIVLGFLQLGPPKQQRNLRADNQRVQALYQISQEIRAYWMMHDKELPTSLEQLPGMVAVDPMSAAAYEYRPVQGTRYELCAVFARGSERRPGMAGQDRWSHGTGRHCFALDVWG